MRLFDDRDLCALDTAESNSSCPLCPRQQRNCRKTANAKR